MKIDDSLMKFCNFFLKIYRYKIDEKLVKNWPQNMTPPQKHNFQKFAIKKWPPKGAVIMGVDPPRKRENPYIWPFLHFLHIFTLQKRSIFDQFLMIFWWIFLTFFLKKNEIFDEFFQFFWWILWFFMKIDEFFEFLWIFLIFRSKHPFIGHFPWVFFFIIYDKINIFYKFSLFFNFFDKFYNFWWFKHIFFDYKW